METLAAKMGVRAERVAEWEQSGRISISQADWLARHTHTPLGYLYLREPQDATRPVPDFRAPIGRSRSPSPDLLDTVNLMARRQGWLGEELIEDGADPLRCVGSCPPGSAPADAASAIREHLELDLCWAER